MDNKVDEIKKLVTRVVISNKDLKYIKTNYKYITLDGSGLVSAFSKAPMAFEPGMGDVFVCDDITKVKHLGYVDMEPFSYQSSKEFSFPIKDILYLKDIMGILSSSSDIQPFAKDSDFYKIQSAREAIRVELSNLIKHRFKTKPRSLWYAINPDGEIIMVGLDKPIFDIHLKVFYIPYGYGFLPELYITPNEYGWDFKNNTRDLIFHRSELDLDVDE